MDWFVHSDTSKRVLLAGTYNAHPVPTVAAIATINRLLANGGEVYRKMDYLGGLLQHGLESIIQSKGLAAVVARQGSAFCIYFMDHCPKDWHDLARNHDFGKDESMRKALIEHGIYVFPQPIKQCSISAVHTSDDIDLTLQCIDLALKSS